MVRDAGNKDGFELKWTSKIAEAFGMPRLDPTSSFSVPLRRQHDFQISRYPEPLGCISMVMFTLIAVDMPYQDNGSRAKLNIHLS